MQLSGASHPQVLTRDRSDLCLEGWSGFILRFHTSATSGSKYLSIFLSQSMLEQQHQEDELNSLTLDQPEVSSMQ